MKTLLCKPSFPVIFWSFVLLLIALPMWLGTWRTRAMTVTNNSTAVVTVSAASYAGGAAPQAPNSIVAAFGTQLARATEVANSQPLPTTLAGTTVKITDSNNVERAAPLFFVSAFQINCLVPDGTAPGDAMVTITSTQLNGDQVISRGTMKVAATAPAIFSATASGSGPPAAQTGRVIGNAFVYDTNPPFEADALNPGLLVPRPVDVGSDSQPAFLILYGTGLRQAANTVRFIIGGVEVTPEFIGAAPGFTGLDQANVRIPSTLRGRGRVDFTAIANGVSSNALTISAAGNSNAGMSIASFSINDGALAGQTLTINGAGFSTTANQNLVRFGNAQGRVVSASATQMQVIVPFGAESGRVTVQNPQGETRSAGAFRVRTSISGIVQTTGTSNSAPVPMENVTVRVIGENLSVRTNRQGTFIIPNISTGPKLIEVDGETTNSSPPFPRVTLKMTVQSDRDNQFTQPVSMQQITGAGVNVGVTGSGAAEPDFRKRIRPRDNSIFVNITDRNVTLDIPTGVAASFPDGKSSGRVNLTVLEKSRLPGIRLPAGVYSSTIVQITPLGTTFTPGASLSFPNPDPANLNAGSKVDFYRYDEDAGTFIKRGTGTVSADKARVVSDGRIVDEASFWLAAAQSGVTTVTGRVIDGLSFPVSGVKVTVNGRGDLTDENGGFIIADVATASTTQVQVEAVLPQQFGIVPRGTSALTNVVVGGVTNVGTIALSNTNQPGLVLSPFVFRFNSNDPPASFGVTLTQPAPAGGLQVALASDTTSVVTVPATVTIPAGQTTVNFNVTRTGTGLAILSATSTLSGTPLESFALVVVAKAAPVLTSLTPTTASAFSRITISGTGFSTDPTNNFAAILRNGQLVDFCDPDENELVEDQQGRLALRVTLPPISNGAAQMVVGVIDDLNGILSDASAPLNFNVLSNSPAAPTLTSLSPSSGKPKDQITINGSGFSTVPSENVVFFRQNGQEVLADVLQSSASQLLVRVPSIFLSQGQATVFARRDAPDGSPSGLSNALDFTLTQGVSAPATPTLASVVNVQTQTASGRDGDFIQATGTNFGANFIDFELGGLANTDPFITLVTFYQNSQLVSFAFPFNVTGTTQLNAEIPTGLAQGAAQITVITLDLESGLISNESAPVNFTITQGSLTVVDEDEPNDAPETATIVPFPAIVQGDADSTDPSGFTVTFNNGVTQPIHDLFYFTLTQPTDLTLDLLFETGDMDLFLLNATPNQNGSYTVLEFSAQRGSAPEFIGRGALPAGNYFVGVSAFSSLGFYDLQIDRGVFTAPPNAAQALSEESRTPVTAERVKSRPERQIVRERRRRP